MTRIDGKLVSASLREQIKEDVSGFVKENNRVPTLKVILVGNDQASGVYVRNKQKACDEVGISSETILLPEDTTQEQLENLVEQYNHDDTVDGILVQLPLPKQLDEKSLLLRIAPEKDVDAFHPYNVGNIVANHYHLAPCTPQGVMDLLKYYNIDVAGKHCVVIGRSDIVGKPMALLLLHANGTVTVAHSKTANLEELTKQADILVSAVGKAKFVKADMVKDGAVVIDVGINRDENGKLCGDVDFDDVSEKASFITPVPGGVGPMTVTELLKNTLNAAKARQVK